MIITSINIKNFRGIRELDIQDCQPRMLVLGFNRSGKTSLLDAIRAVFLGKVQGADGKALEVREWIGPWARTAEVTIGFTIGDESFEARMRVSKTVSLEISRPGLPTWIGPPKEVRGALWKHLGVSQRHRECAMMPRAYLVGDDLGQMISDLGGGGIDPKALDTLCGENAAWIHDYAKSIRVLPHSLDNLLSIGASMFEARTEKNARLKALDAQIEKHKDVMPPANSKGAILGVKDIPSVRQAIAELQGDRDALVGEMGAAQSAPNGANLEQERAERTTALEKARSERAAIKYDPERTEIARCAAALTAATAAREAAEARVNEGKVANANAIEAHRRAGNDLHDFERIETPKAGACCPTCRQKVTKEALAAFQAWAREQVEAARARVAEASALSSTTLAALEPLRNAEKTARDAERNARMALETAEREANNVVFRLTALDARIESLSEPLAIPEAPKHRAVADIEAEIVTVESRIEKARAALDALNQIAARQDATDEREALAEEIARLSWAIPLFHNDRKSNHASALNSLSRNEQQAFLDACNARLEPFGVALGVNTSGKSLEVTFGGTDTETRIPVTQVSGAEMLLAEWSVATAFADGGIVLLDEFNRLDGVNNPLLFDELTRHPGCIWISSAYGQGEEPDLDAIREWAQPAGVVWMERAVSEVAA